MLESLPLSWYIRCLSDHSWSLLSLASSALGVHFIFQPPWFCFPNLFAYSSFQPFDLCLILSVCIYFPYITPKIQTHYLQFLTQHFSLDVYNTFHILHVPNWIPDPPPKTPHPYVPAPHSMTASPACNLLVQNLKSHVWVLCCFHRLHLSRSSWLYFQNIQSDCLSPLLVLSLCCEPPLSQALITVKSCPHPHNNIFSYFCSHPTATRMSLSKCMSDHVPLFLQDPPVAPPPQNKSSPFNSLQCCMWSSLPRTFFGLIRPPCPLPFNHSLLFSRHAKQVFCLQCFSPGNLDYSLTTFKSLVVTFSMRPTLTSLFVLLSHLLIWSSWSSSPWWSHPVS